MGYYTRFELSVVEDDSGITLCDHKLAISEVAGYDDCFDDEIKWYGYKEDMQKYSKAYPNTIFLLDGIGEENGDVWKSFFKNGERNYIKAQIVFDVPEGYGFGITDEI
jgi:hypothetical protein